MREILSIKIDEKQQRRLERKISELPEKVFKRHVRKASNAAMTPVLKAARQNVPVDEGDLKKALGKKQKTYAKNHSVWTGVGSRKGKGAAHAHLVEFGHRMVTGGTAARNDGKLRGSAAKKEKTGKGRVVGFVPPHPFLRPAFEANKSAALQIYRTKIAAGVLEEAKK